MTMWIIIIQILLMLVRNILLVKLIQTFISVYPQYYQICKVCYREFQYVFRLSPYDFLCVCFQNVCKVGRNNNLHNSHSERQFVTSQVWVGMLYQNAHISQTGKDICGTAYKSENQHNQHTCSAQ